MIGRHLRTTNKQVYLDHNYGRLLSTIKWFWSRYHCSRWFCTLALMEWLMVFEKWNFDDSLILKKARIEKIWIATKTGLHLLRAPKLHAIWNQCQWCLLLFCSTVLPSTVDHKNDESNTHFWLCDCYDCFTVSTCWSWLRGGSSCSQMKLTLDFPFCQNLIVNCDTKKLCQIKTFLIYRFVAFIWGGFFNNISW